jgi:hypothetical protein
MMKKRLFPSAQAFGANVIRLFTYCSLNAEPPRPLSRMSRESTLCIDRS